MTEITPSTSMKTESGSVIAITDNQQQRLNDLFEKSQQYAQFVNDFRFEKSPNFIINGQMRNYQIEALNWLISLYENRISGILADEMGLGKTLQSIAMLGYLKFSKNINGPFLVIGTKSVISSWTDEFKKFCPALQVVPLVNDKYIRNEKITWMMSQKFKWDVCLTTFETVLAERTFFRHCQWHYVVVDEAHKLKNEKTQFSQFVRELQSKNRLMLTGTPLQDNLHELWALLNYLMPDMFNSSDDFESWFNPNKSCDQESIKCLQSILKPFFLRRLKADVETTLLPKIESKLFVGLTTLQQGTYIKVATTKFKSSATRLQELRKISNHPYLIHGVEPGPPYKTYGKHIVDTSGKMMLLDKLLRKLKAKGSRVLLFSQFIDMLDIIEDYLDWQKYEFRRLDGKTSYVQRANDIDEFNAENSTIFIYIISTQTGALGINLQGADTVIIYDPDWNPQTDIQAIDRAHRIGQKKQVEVFRLITENTVDEFIVQRAEVKLLLRNKIVQQGRTFENSKVNEVEKRKILNFSVESITASLKAGVTDVNLHDVIMYSQRKTHDESEKLRKLNEIQLREMRLEKSSITLFNRNHTSGNASIRVIQQANQNQPKNVVLLKPSIAPVNHNQTTGDKSVRVTQQSNQSQLQNVALEKPSIATVNHNQTTGDKSVRVTQQSNQNQLQNVALEKPSIAPVNHNQTTGDKSVRVTQQSNQSQLQNVALQKPSIAPVNHNQTTVDKSVRVTQQSNQNNLQNLALEKPSITSVNQSQNSDNIRVTQQRNQNHVQNVAFEKPSITPVNRSETFGDNRIGVIQKSNELLSHLSANTEGLLAEDLFKWSSVDYKIFHAAVLKFGRFDVASVAEMIPSKTMEEVAKYHDVFFRRGPNKSEHIRKVVTNIKLAELKNRNRVEALRWKMLQFGKSEFEVTLNAQKQHAKFTRDHDRYLICAVSRYGSLFNVYDRVISDIRFHSDFGLFLTFRFGTMTDQEIIERIDDLISSIEDEYLNHNRPVNDQKNDNRKRLKLN